MTPFAVLGTVCEVGWEELHSCNNGGGQNTTVCRITIETGVITENFDGVTVSDTEIEQKTEEETKAIDKTVTLEKVATLNLNAGGNANGGYSGGNLKGLMKKWGGKKSTAKPRDKPKTTPTPVDGNGTTPIPPPRKGTASARFGIGGGVSDDDEDTDKIVDQTTVILFVIL